MTRPLGSTSTAPSRGFPATTSRSASASRDGTHCLAVQPLGRLPLAIRRTRERQYRDTPSHVPCKSSRPDSRRLHAGHRLASQRFTRQAPPGLTYYTPVLMPPNLSNDTSTAIPETEDCAPSFRSPPDASRAPFPHRSPRRSSANAACGGLEPPTAGRLRRAKPSSPAQHRVKKLYLQTELLSTFVAHVASQTCCPYAMR